MDSWNGAVTEKIAVRPSEGEITSRLAQSLLCGPWGEPGIWQ
jgi:hypothetical protein